MDEIKKYTIKGKEVTQSELSLNDGKKVMRLLREMDWSVFTDGKNSMYDIVSEYLDQDMIENVLAISLKGDLPKGELGDNLTAGKALDMVNDFFGLNATLMESVMNFLANLASFKQVQETSRNPSEKSSDSTSTKKE
jgi:hypothetical protein